MNFPAARARLTGLQDFIHGDGQKKLTADQVKGIADFFDGKLRKAEGEFNRLGGVVG